VNELKITVVDSSREYRTLELDPAKEYLLGRQAECDIVIKSNLASRVHAKIFFKGDKWNILDNNSTNGTVLNGKKITSAHIANYDVLRIGDHIIEFNEDEILQSIISGGGVSDGSISVEEKFASVEIVAELEKKIAECLKKFAENSTPSNYSGELKKFQDNIDVLINDFGVKATRMNSELKVLFELTKSIAEILNLKELLNVALDLVNRIRRVERGLVFLYDPKNGNFIPYVTRKMSVGDLKFDANVISSSILSMVKEKLEPVLIKNSMTDERFASSESVVALSGKSILCIPLVSKQGIQGVFYLEKSIKNPFTEDDLTFLKNFASAVSVAIENTKLIMAIKRERQIRNNMERFISPNLIDQLSQGGEMKLDGEKREITVFFADIKNFTSMSEKLSVEDIFAMLNHVFSGVADIIFEFDGTLDKFIGDCVMAFFGAPVAREDDSLRAVRVAMRIISLAQEVAADLKKRLNVDFGFSIGINSGEAIVGNLGSMDRMEYTAIGDTVNLASRLQSKAGFNEIVINDSVYEKIKDKIECKPLEPFHVKGKEQPVKAYIVLGEN